jgi:hypothetical protein
VLDGEVAIYDEQLRSRFDWLREPDPTAVAAELRERCRVRATATCRGAKRCYSCSV